MGASERFSLKGFRFKWGTGAAHDNAKPLTGTGIYIDSPACNNLFKSGVNTRDEMSLAAQVDAIARAPL